MKYVLTFLFVVLLENASARTITRFRDSESLTVMAQFLFDSSEDIPQPIRLSDKKINIKDLNKCTSVSAEHVYSDVANSINKVLRFYPDEDLPFEQALTDLEDYLDHRTFKKCIFEKVTPNSTLHTTYYRDQKDQIHVRLDTTFL